MRIKDDLFGKEVIDADIQIAGKVTDVVMDKVTFEITDLVIKKTGLSEQIKSSENLVPIELVKVIGDKILLKGDDDIIQLIIMPTKEYLIDLLKENEVFLQGDFTLSSGKKSDYYINMKKAITDPEILSTISKLITDQISDDNIDKVAGPALGAVPIATAVSLESKLPLLMIRKEKKGYGTSKLIEGELNEGDDVIVVEDVSTTGGSFPRIRVLLMVIYLIRIFLYILMMIKVF